MKKIIQPSLVMLILFFLTGCGQQAIVNQAKQVDDVAINSSAENTNQVNTENEATQTETLSPTKISAQVPDGWLPVEGSVAPLQYMKNTASFIAKTENFGTTNLDEVSSKALDIFKKTFSNVKSIGGIEKLTVDGKDARRFVFTGEASSLNMKYEYVYVLAGNEVYAITFGDLATTFDDISADYETILSTIKF